MDKPQLPEKEVKQEIETSALPITENKTIESPRDLISPPIRVPILLNHQFKNIKGYLFEFLMLFLAVFCGFLADNYREYLSEKETEKQYISSLLVDLNTDNKRLEEVIKFSEKQMRILDTLLLQFTDPAIKENSASSFNQWSRSNGFQDFIYSDRTIEQLKSTGALRLIENKAASDSLMQYDAAVRRLLLQQATLNDLLTDQTLFNSFYRFTDLQNKASGTIPLTTFGKNNLDVAFANRSYWKGGLNYLNIGFREIKTEGEQLINFIKKEYEIKN